MAKPTPPSNIPQDSFWNESHKQWLHGVLLADGTRKGKWQIWNKDGVLISEYTYGDNGKYNGEFKHFHPNGAIAQSGNYADGKLHGLVWSQKQGKSSPHFPSVGQNEINRVEIYYENGKESRARYFRDGKMVDYYGSTPVDKIPQNAWYIRNSYEWTICLDDPQEYRSVGKWGWWRWDGSKISEAQYNDQGQLHGLVQRFHNDGTVACSGQYENDKQEGEHWYYRSKSYSSENYFNYSESNQILKKVIVFRQGQEQSRRYYTYSDQECTSKGFPVIKAELHDLFQVEIPEFLQKSFPQYCERTRGQQPVEANLLAKLQEQFQRYWGCTLPNDLGQYYLLAKTYQPQTFQYHRCALPAFDQFDQWLAEGKNVFEEAVIQAQREYPYDHLIQWFLGGASLSSFTIENSNHKSFLYQVYPQDHSGFVYPFIHEGYSQHWQTKVEGRKPLAANLDSFLYYQCLFSATFEFEKLNAQQFEPLRQKLLRHIEIPYYFHGYLQLDNNYINLEEMSVQSRRVDPDLSLQKQMRKAQWMIEWLRAETNPANIQSYLTFEEGKSINHQQNLQGFEQGNLPLMLQALWQAYLLEATELQTYLNLAKNSPIIVVQHAGQLIEQFIRQGRNQLGYIFDLENRRKSLGLKPVLAGV